MSGIAKITNFFFNIMELLLQLIPYGYSNSGLPPQHHKVLLPLRLKMRTLRMVWACINDGIVPLLDECQGVGSTDTKSSAARIIRVTHSSLAAPCAQGVER